MKLSSLLVCKFLCLQTATEDGVALFPSRPILPTSEFKRTTRFFHRLVSFQHAFDFQLLVGEKREKAREQGRKYCENEMTEHLRGGYAGLAP